MNNLIDVSVRIPEAEKQLTISISPVCIVVDNRNSPLELRITLPANGSNIPIILLSHGHGPSLYLPSKDGYAPLANYYAEQGFAVIQPTHANSKVAGLSQSHPDAPLFLKERYFEMQTILNNLASIENNSPYLAGRLDKQRIAVVGHSAGALTAAMLLGMQLIPSQRASKICQNMPDERIKAGVLLAAVGKGGTDLHDAVRERYPELNPDYLTMTTKTLVVYGDQDVSAHFTTRGADWHADPFYLSPGSDYLLTLIGAKHGLGGIAGFDAKETDDENSDRLSIVQKMTSAYLKSALYNNNAAWQEACDALKTFASQYAHFSCKH
ncbi:alpha/beta hydrolase family protein [Pseudoalteromonas mariniglutinosa]|uniref:alpha/beta hydrolase family protein n=1 Tax=Pseudoalteromonas mariniglutinosa TaxID=206042 RepID=UPI00384C4DAC